jgi:hypothetical protein
MRPDATSVCGLTLLVYAASDCGLKLLVTRGSCRTRQRKQQRRRTLARSRCLLYLIYWYNSTENDAAKEDARAKQVLTLLALLVQKY